MAKESKVQVQVETVEVKEAEVKVEDTKIEDKPVSDIQINVEPVSKKVKIKAKSFIRIYIGNRWYEFEKGEEKMVDAFVKEVLLERGALDVL